MKPLFITGIGTGIGKTLVSAIITQALQAHYWKPVQAGFNNGTDSLTVQQLVTNTYTIIHKELYKLKLSASPHIAAKEEGINIDLKKIANTQPTTLNRLLIIEGAGGLLVPLNDNEFIIDLIKKLNARVILVSRNYLGSINHSLLTADVCRANKIEVIGWVFNDQYLHYEEEIVNWSGYKKIASIPFEPNINPSFVQQQATIIKESLLALL